jgi:3-methyladenine DNA glycosylase AlkC
MSKQNDHIDFKINIHKTNENDTSNENILCKMEETDDETNQEYNINVDIASFLQEFEKIAQLQQKKNSNQVMNESELYAEISNYDMNFSVKQLALICEYYELNKALKLNKLKKYELIENIMIYENNPKNIVEVYKRKQLWNYLDELKSDKFFKKFVIW